MDPTSRPENASAGSSAFLLDFAKRLEAKFD
jgi:hypothetical protein